MITLLDILATLCIGLLIGTEFAVSAFINPVLRRLDNYSQGEAIRLFARRLGRAMPFWYAASLLLLIVEAIVRRHQSGDGMLLLAGAIWAVVIILTLLYLVPINNRLIRMDSGAFDENAQREHQKWDSLHRARVLALCASMLCFLVAVHF